MVRFSHIADCHLGSWRDESLQALNFQSFQKAIEISIQEKVDFVIIAGDLFDSAYPPIEILKEAFHVLSKLKQENIPCYLIAGSHDYSVSGKTFLDVLERAGFCINVHKHVEQDGKFVLQPTFYKNIALYGYPGRKSGMEVEDVKRIKIENPHRPRILFLHTTLDFVKGNLPIESVDENMLPEVEYAALGHVHVVRRKAQFVYPGPTFPNNFQELAELRHGGFYIVDFDNACSLTRYDFPLKEVLSLEMHITDAPTATDAILEELAKHDVADKIVLLRLKGTLATGKTADIQFAKIEEQLKKRGVYCYLKNTNELKTRQADIALEAENVHMLEEEIVGYYLRNNISIFNGLVPALLQSFGMEKKEDEKSAIFEKRLLDEARAVLQF